MTTTAARTARHHDDQHHHHHQARPDGQAANYLAPVAGRLTARGIITTLEPIGGIPVLTAEEPAADPDPATVSINPGTPTECTCTWTPGPGASSEATAATIAAVLAAIRTGQMRDGQPSRGDLTAPVFQALYPGYQLGGTGGIYIVTPKGTPWFAGRSLGAIARLISDHQDRDASPHEGTAMAPSVPSPGATE